MPRRDRGLQRATGRPARSLPLLALVVAVLVLAPAAGAHAYLESSTPAPGGSAPEGTSVLALRFTEQVDPDQVDVRLEDATGAVLGTETDVPEARPTEVRVLTDPLANGTYQLSWHVLSVDGHAERGSMGFTIGEGGEEAAGLEDRTGEPPNLLDVTDGVARALVLTGLLAAVGVPLFTSEIARLREIPSRVPATLTGLLGASMVGILVRAGVLAHALDVAPLGALRTRPGGLLAFQGLLVALALGIVAWAWSRPAGDRPRVLLLALLPASLAVIVNSMGGHGIVGYASREAVAGHVARTLHVLIVGLWGGGVLGFLLVRGRDSPDTATVIRRFFPVGVISVVVLAVTGLYQAYVHLPRLLDLWTSPYGWILLAKSTLLVVLVGFGAFHQRWVGPALERGQAALGTFRRSVGAELVTLGLLVGLAGVLAATPLPEASLDDSKAPVAAFEQEVQTQDFHVRLSFEDDAIRTGEEHVLGLELRPRTSVRADEVTVNLSANPPDGNRSRAIEIERSGEGSWSAEGVVFGQAGTWSIVATLDTPVGIQEAPFEVPVSSGNTTAGPARR